MTGRWGGREGNLSREQFNVNELQARDEFTITARFHPSGKRQSRMYDGLRSFFSRSRKKSKPTAREIVDRIAKELDE